MHGFTSNDTMFSVKARPWHRFGSIVTEAPTIGEAIKLAGLDWKVGLKPLYTVTETVGQHYTAKRVDQQVPAYATYRETDGTILGVVGPSYRPLQNEEAFSFFQPWLDAGLAKLETAGRLFDGRKIWIMAKIQSSNSMIVPGAGDEVEKFVLLSNSHDGTNAVRVGFTPIRVVCNNTLAMAHHDRTSSLIRVRHTPSVQDNVAALTETMNLVNRSFEATAEQYRFLATREISQEDVKKYIKKVFSIGSEKETVDAPVYLSEIPEDKRFIEDDSKSRILPKIIELYETGRGNHLPGVRGTYWAVYNAITEYLQYYRGKTDESRFNSLWFNDGQRISTRALQTAVVMAGKQ